MLHYNKASDSTVRLGRSSHVAHAFVVGLHTLCCGIPAALALSGIALGAVAGSGALLRAHDWLHGYELEVLLLSIILVVVGGIAEWRRRRERDRFPRLYALSIACLLANGVIVAEHRMGEPRPIAAAVSAR